MSTCIKTTCLMEIEDPLAGRGTFVMRNDDDDNVARRIQLLDDTWDEMGRPLEITVTIEPGDRLNDEEPS